MADVTYYGWDYVSEEGALMAGAAVTEKSGYLSANATSSSTSDSLFLKDIAQSRCFTVEFSQDSGSVWKGLSFRCPGGAYSKFLPVKSIAYKFTSYSNMSIPLAIFGDFQLLQRKQISTINFTCYDLDNDSVERAVRQWENECFPYNAYVAYFEDIKETLIYRSFDVKGRLNYYKKLEVIPTGDVSVNRSYEENSEKLVTFSVAVVGIYGASAGGTKSASSSNSTGSATGATGGVGTMWDRETGKAIGTMYGGPGTGIIPDNYDEMTKH